MRWRMVIFNGLVAASDPDDGAQDASPEIDGCGGRVPAEAGEEAFEVAGERPEVGVAVGGLGVEGGDLVLQAGLAGSEGGHAEREARRW